MDFSKYVTVLFIALVQLFLVSKRSKSEPSQHLSTCLTFLKLTGLLILGVLLQWAFEAEGAVAIWDWGAAGGL